MKRRKLLLADDSELNRAILANMLEADFEIIEVSNGKEVLAALQAYRSSLSALLLDIVMPELDGFGVLEEMNRLHWIDAFPTIIISAETGGAYIDHAFALGASDYISRPFVPGIIRRRIMNAILLHTKKQQMMDLVADWFSQRGHSDEILLTILEYAVETRSGEGGTHMTGVDTITGLLLRRLLEKPNPYGLTEADVNVICTASGLHDLGKLLVPSEILKKPGKLTAEEFEIVKRHTVMGAQLIADLPVYQNEKLVQYAITICRWHHERWNGEGYPDGLWGDGIPIAAQVVSLADAYDALTNARSYKTAFDHETALAMLHNGECGSFNPLLLTCLDEVAETIRQAKQERRILQNKPTVQKAVDELYSGQDLPTVRVAQQLEEYRTQYRFFSDLTQDYWFKYTLQPASLQLSRSAAEWLGLPRMIVNPMEHPGTLAILGADTRETLHQALETRRIDDRYLELTVTIYVSGKPCRCQMALLVFWDATNQDRYRAILGKVLDIDESFGRLTRYDAALAAPAAPALLPILAGPDDVLQLQSSQVGPVLQSYRRMFATVRLVDPGLCLQVSADAHGHRLEQSAHCYAIWGKERRCSNCIAQEAIRTRRTQSKIESAGSDIFYVLALCAEIDGVPYALECANPLQSSGSEENLLNQLLVRNRQVYIDSATKVFNRRYYDTRIRGLTGAYALAMFDIDDFKAVNDTFGHAAGDLALYHVAQTVRAKLRGSDEIIRYGGDEFFLLFHGLPGHNLERKLQALCQAVAQIELSDYPALRLSISIGGIAAAGRIAELVQKADRALYQAKKTKGCAVIYKEDSHAST